MGKKILRSVSTMKLMHLLSEGEIGGLSRAYFSNIEPNTDEYIKESLKSVYFDDTPIITPNDESSFQGIKMDVRTGTQDQTKITGFGDGVETPSAIFNEEITPETPVVRSTTENDVDGVRLILNVNALFRISSKGKYSNKSAQHKVYISTDNTNWQYVKDINISGVTLGGYEEGHRIDRPADSTGIWYFKIERTNAVEDDDDDQNRSYFKQFIEIQDVSETYPNSAYLSLGFDAQNTGTQVPKTEFEIAGILCLVPDTFVPHEITDNEITAWGYYKANDLGTPAANVNEALAYWISQGGNYSRQWTDDPAWIIRELLTNQRFGIGSFIDASDVDDVSFFEYSFYNMELIPDFQENVHPNNQEPRYTFNGVIAKREDATKVLQSICSSSNAYLLITTNAIQVLQDRPTTPIGLITRANIKDDFRYTGLADLENITTSLDITFNDKNDRYLPKTITISDYIKDGSVYRAFNSDTDGELSDHTTAIDRFGLNKEGRSVFGITSESMARRLGHWYLDSILNGGRRVSFVTGYENAYLMPGDVILISDALFTEERLGGLVKNYDNNILTLDQEFTFEDGDYFIHIYDYENSQVKKVPITEQNTTTDQITFTEFSPPIYSSYIIEKDTQFSDINIEPIPFRVISVQETPDNGEYAIEALFYDENKFPRIENNIIIPPDVFTPIEGRTVEPVQQITITPIWVQEADGRVSEQSLTFEWPDSQDPLFAYYEFIYSVDGNQLIKSDRLYNNQFQINPANLGLYDLTVFVYNHRGVRSPPFDYLYNFSEDNPDLINDFLPPQSVTTSTGLVFNTPDLTFTWEDNNTGVSYQNRFKDYEITVYDGDEIVHTGHTNELKFTYTNNQNRLDFGRPTREIKIGVSIRDILLKPSAVTQVTFNNPPPNAPSNVTAFPIPGIGYRLSHDPSIASDAVGVNIYHDTSPLTGTADPAYLVLQDKGTFHDIAASVDTEFFYQIAFYDTFSEEDLLVTAGSITTSSQDPVTNPSEITSISAIPRYDSVNNESLIDISWSSANFANTYDVQVIRQDTGAIFTLSVSTTTTTVEVLPNETYQIQVRGRNSNAVGPWITTTATSSADTEAPNPPILQSITEGIGAVSVRWENPADMDFDVTEVYFSTTNNSSSATKYDETRGTNMFISPLTAGQTIFVWARARDTSNNLSVFSNSLNAVPQAIPTNLGPGSVTEVEIEDGAILARHVSSDQIEARHLQANIITSDNIIARSLTAEDIQANTLTGNEIQANSLTAGEIDTSTLRVGDNITIEDGAITARHVQANSLTASEIDTSTLRVGDNITIEDGAITADMLSAGEIITNTAQIRNGIITNADIANAQITDAKIANQISSNNWNNTSKTGWRITGTQSGGGLIETNALAIWSSGTPPVPILLAGATAVESAKTADDAANLGGQSSTEINNNINQAQSTADNAETTANQANTKAGQAQNTANQAQNTANNAETTANQAQTDAANAITKVFRQNNAPSGAKEGDIWVDANANNKMYVRRSNTWQVIGASQQITPGNISTFIQNASIAQAQMGSASIGTAQIINASIDQAKIKNLTIDSLKLKANSISFLDRQNWAGTVTVYGGNSYNNTLLTTTIPNAVGQIKLQIEAEMSLQKYDGLFDYYRSGRNDTWIRRDIDFSGTTELYVKVYNDNDLVIDERSENTINMDKIFTIDGSDTEFREVRIEAGVNISVTYQDTGNTGDGYQPKAVLRSIQMDALSIKR